MVCHWSAQNQNLKVSDLDEISEYSHAISGCFPRLYILFRMRVWKGDIYSSSINDNTLGLGFAPHCTDEQSSLTLAWERLNTSPPVWCND